nr:uncharacterized protein LOC101251909 [Solanum lycopersicum]
MPSTGDGASSEVQQQIPVATTAKIDHNHPLFIHPSDTQGSVLISIQLLGSENYSLWSKSLKLVLLGKNKLEFLLGTCKKEMYSECLHDVWDRCNAIVLGWIMNTVSKSLISTVIYGSDAHSVWEDLRERFDKVNASRAFYLHKESVTMSQGTSSVSIYFSRLRELWDEAETLILCPSCACPESKQYIEHLQFQKLWQFLMGLNESYAHARSQVLMQIPVPSVNQAYAMIVSVESQRIHGAGNTFASAEAVSETTFMSNRMPPSSSQSVHGGYYNNNTTSSGNGRGISNFQNNGYRNKGYGDGRTGYSAGKTQLYCEFCHYKGHTKETCYKLHGYPKKKGGVSSYANNAASASNESGMIDSTSSSNARINESSNDTSLGQGVSMFTQEQYYEILQMLRKGKSKEVDTMANVATAGVSGTSGKITALMSDMSQINWIIDTGASNHMVHNFGLMSQSANLDVQGGMRVNLPTGDQVSISHIGEPMILKDKVVKDVLFVPEFKYNLLSVSQLTKQLRCTVVFFPDFCIFQDLFNGRVLGIGKENQGLYILNTAATTKLSNDQGSSGKYAKEDACKRNPISFNSTVESASSLWHKRLGHAPLKVLSRIKDLNIVSVNDQHCSICPIAKQSRLPFPISLSHSSSIFDIIHGDVW